MHKGKKHKKGYWENFKNSKVGNFVDAKGLENMFGMDKGIGGTIGNYFGYDNDEGSDMVLDASTIISPAGDFVKAKQHWDKGDVKTAAMYAGFSLLPFSATPWVKGTKAAINKAKKAFKGTKVKPKVVVKPKVKPKANEVIHIPRERGVATIPTNTIPGPVQPRNFVQRNFWDGNRKWWTMGAGAYGVGKGAYEDYQENKQEEERQSIIESTPSVNTDGMRKFKSGGVTPTMENVQEAISGGGSVSLPGGSASPVAEGSSAIEYSGQTHEQSNGENSGILVDNAEVENGETQDKVTMRKGGAKKDYFFSNHLKKGGIPIAEWHKEIVKNGDSQQAKDALAREQEIIAGRNPEVVAKDGGFKKYEGGGQKNPWDMDLDKFTKDTDGDGIPDVKDDDIDGDGVPNGIDKEPNVPHVEEKKEAKKSSPHKGGDRFDAFGENYNKIEDANTQAGYTGGGEDGSYRATDLGEEGIAGTQKGAGKGYYGEVNESNMTDFYNRNSSLMKEMGLNSPDEFDPAKHTKEFQTKFNSNLSSTFDNDPDLQAKLEEQGISKEDYIKQSGFHGSGATGIDGKMGEFTWSKTSMGKKSKPSEEDTNINEEIIEETNTDITSTQKKTGRKRWGDGVDLSMLQFLPAAVAMTDKPDYMDNPDVIVPATVRAERIKADKIGMVNFNAERAAIDMDGANMDQFIQNSGGGMSNISNKMANQTSKFKARMAINAQETKQNVGIEGENVANKLNADATNQTKALEASSKNQQAQGNADELNAKNKMYVNEFNKGADAATFDRKLQALDTMAQGAMQMQMSREKNNTDLAIAEVVDGNRNAWERYQGEETTTTSNPKYTDADKHLRELLKKQGVKEGSDEWKKYIT